jgi:hypothetical protein
MVRSPKITFSCSDLQQSTHNNSAIRFLEFFIEITSSGQQQAEKLVLPREFNQCATAQYVKTFRGYVVGVTMLRKWWEKGSLQT